MIKKLLTAAFICSSIIAGAQSFSQTYSFTAVTASTGVTDPTPPPTATGLTFGAFSAVGTPTANPNASGRFSFTGWPTGSSNGVDTYATMTGSYSPTEYYEVTLTPQAGYTVALNTIAFTVQRSGTGVRSYAVKASVDNFVTNLPATVSNASLSVVGSNEFFWNYDAGSSALTGSTINLLGATSTTAVTFRFYGWNSEGSSGTFSIDNVIFTGSVTGVSSCTAPAITSATSNAPICSSDPLMLQSTVTGSGPLTYSWTGTGSFSSTSAASPTVTGAASGNYTLSVTNACGTATANVNATVNPTPTVTVNAASICSGGTATLTANGATTYSWSPAATLNATTGSVVNANPTATTIYTIVGTAGSCSVMATTSVNVIASPTLAVNSTSICAGNSATLTASGVSTYTWTSPVSNNTSVNVTPASTTVYTVSGNAAGCAGTFTATGTVSVTALPTLTVSPASPTICAGQSSTLTVSGVTTQTWAPGTQTTVAIVVTPTTQTTYTVTGSNSGCVNSNTVMIHVNPLPSVVTTSASICAGKTATLTASGAATYTWNPGGVTGSTFTVVPTGAFTTYTVVGTSSLSCSKSVAVNVFAIPNPTVTASVSNSVICAGSSVTFTAGGAATYVWTNGITGGTAFTPTGTATYTVTGTSIIGSCTGTAVTTVTVNMCTGIKENSDASVLNIYPNPSNGNFTVQSSVYPATLLVYDVTGKQVFKKDITDMETLLNVSQLNNGIYYVNLSTGTGSANYKLVIAK